MFDKNKFAQVLKNINETYDSQRDFAKKSEINRTYLSQYMNMKLDEPPKPRILEKLANFSNGITTYEELMTICGYIKNNDLSVLPYYADLIDMEEERIHKYKKYNFSKEEKAIYELFSHYIIDCSIKKISFSAILPNINDELSKIDNISIVSKEKIISSLEYCYNYFSKRSRILSKFPSQYNISRNNMPKIPILGTVKAGYDWLAEENVIGYITDKNTVKDYENNINEYYALKVTGDSMLPLLANGDMVIVHNQDDVESGQTAIVLINGEEATIKKVVKTNEGIELHAMNPYYPIKKFTFEDMKKIPIKIIGRVKEAKIKGAFE